MCPENSVTHAAPLVAGLPRTPPRDWYTITDECLTAPACFHSPVTRFDFSLEGAQGCAHTHTHMVQHMPTESHQMPGAVLGADDVTGIKLATLLDRKSQFFSGRKTVNKYIFNTIGGGKFIQE